MTLLTMEWTRASILLTDGSLSAESTMSGRQRYLSFAFVGIAVLAAMPALGAAVTGSPNCGQMTANGNVFITYAGPTSGCTSVSGDCSVNESIAFHANSFGYNYSCAVHTFTWSFGDGSMGSGQSPTHSYSTAGTYNVGLTITHPQQTVNLSRTVTVNSTTGGGGCPTMIPNGNVFPLYIGPTSNCTAVSGTCTVHEPIAFHASSAGYNYDCASHTFTWAFGDGTIGTGNSLVHSYNTTGTYIVTLAIDNGQQIATMERTVQVGSGGGPGPGPCSSRLPNVNIFIAHTGQAKARESTAFSVATVGYSFACAAHMFQWSFGDGSTSNSIAPVHTYTAPGTYNVTLKITRGLDTVTLTRTVNVDGAGRRRSVRH